MDEQEYAPTKVNAIHADEKVCFSVTDCSLDKKYSFWSLVKGEAELLVKRLKEIEKMTWKQFAGLPRKNGLTKEKSASKSFCLIEGQDTSDESKMTGEAYYFHFRIQQKGLFRVFGYQSGRCFRITHIDPKGKIHH